MQDEKETIEHWSNFKHADILDNYISLQGKDTYLIPKNSMTEKEYELLKNIISDKMK